MVKAHHHESSAGQRPRNVGIKAMEIYFPQTYVSQKDLEVFDGVSEGKYTIGLAQENMAVCSELEDINSMCMTAIQLLMDKYNLLPKDIGRIEVGTETIVDKSKAVKTALMQLFGENPDIEGVDSKNACYGGTAAVLNSQAWVESSAWDGRYAIALAGDIAVYEKGNARPTGGAGIVAMLIGPDAPLVFEPVRATHMEDVWDFYKPVLDSEYPTVDGHLSNICYQRSLDNCYVRYAERTERLTRKPFTVNDADYAIFHAPYNKLVQKSFGRYMWNDYLRFPKAFPDLADAFGKYQDITPDASYVDKHFLETLRKVSQPSYKRMVAPSELITKECGNSYCGSTYAGLLSLIANEADNLQNKRVLLFSYGSGSAATLFSVRATGDVASIRDHTRVKERLAARTKLTPAEFTELLAVREKTHAKLGYKPQQDKSILRKGTFYLSKIDDKGRRQYARAYSTSAATRVTATAVAPATSAVSSVLPTVARALRRLAAL